jgi:hypothetical protein
MLHSALIGQERMTAFALAVEVVKPILLDIRRCGHADFAIRIIMLRPFCPLASRFTGEQGVLTTIYAL